MYLTDDNDDPPCNAKYNEWEGQDVSYTHLQSTNEELFAAFRYFCSSVMHDTLH